MFMFISILNSTKILKKNCQHVHTVKNEIIETLIRFLADKYVLLQLDIKLP